MEQYGNNVETVLGEQGTVEQWNSVAQCSGTVQQHRTVLLNSVEEQCEQCGGTVWWNSGTV